MESLKTESVPPPPAVIGSIKAGFDTVAAHITAILMPLILDLFLWLGPRLSLEKWYSSLVPQMAESWRILGISADQFQQMNQQNMELLPGFNLFWLLRTFPIGISSLVSGPFFSREAPGTPLSLPSVLQVTSGWDLLRWLVLLFLVGWIGGAFYFHGVARLIPHDARFAPLSPTRVIGQSMLISVFWSLIVLMVGMPIFMFMAILFELSPIVGQVAIFAFSLLSMWLIVPLFFWPHGVFLRNENALRAIWSSWKLARFALPASSMFVLTIFLIGVGLNFLWAIPPSNSWMALVGLLGHAFVTTALLAASFIYYRDMNAWLTMVIERMKTRPLMRA